MLQCKDVIWLFVIIAIGYAGGCKFKPGDLGKSRTDHRGITQETQKRLRDRRFTMSNEQTGRLNVLERECKKYDSALRNQSRTAAIPHLVVDEKHKILFCAIPKVASSNWKRVFIDGLHHNGAAGIRNVHASKLLPDLRDYPEEEQDYMLRNYFKFMFVRDPLERLLSAYRNKLENRPVEWVKRSIEGSRSSDILGSNRKTQKVEVILRVKRGKVGNDSVPSTISFRGFVEALTDVKYRISHYNSHWKQYHKLCHPCVIRYDFIGKMETFSEDLDSVKAATGLGYERWFDRVYRTTVPSTVKTYFESLEPSLVNKLLAMYDVDMQLFSYNGE